MAAVVVTEYSPQWPETFRSVRVELLRALSPSAFAVEHVGSTSVPGLAAKPVLDIVIGVPGLPDIEVKIPALAGAGFDYVCKHERELPNRRYFVNSAGPMRVHVHAVELGAGMWIEYLAFRDLLRSDSGIRSAYEALKLGLA